MDKKVIDLTEILTKTKIEEKTQSVSVVKKVTNPIFKKLMQFKNADLSKKFDINDLLR